MLRLHANFKVNKILLILIECVAVDNQSMHLQLSSCLLQADSDLWSVCLTWTRVNQIIQFVYFTNILHPFKAANLVGLK